MMREVDEKLSIKELGPYAEQIDQPLNHKRIETHLLPAANQLPGVSITANKHLFVVKLWRLSG